MKLQKLLDLIKNIQDEFVKNYFLKKKLQESTVNQMVVDHGGFTGQRKSRRLDALSKLNTGWGVGDTISYLVRDYKITRRSANLDVAWASTELCKNLDKSENAKRIIKKLHTLEKNFRDI